MTRKAVPVFVGPSLPPTLRPRGPFDWRPPATAGDMLALIDRPPERLCLIDGFFDSRPATWHKELLMLIARGTVVFGAASMGALRAAELHPFGMIGVGAIFSAYRDGRLRGDDEVALIHATGELDWAPLSVPMVEFRATLLAACRARILGTEAARRIRALVHDVHFIDRDWPTIEKTCLGAKAIDPEGMRALRSLHVPLKTRDALACLALARSWRGALQPALAAPDTWFIRRLAAEVAERVQVAPEAPSPRRRRKPRPSRRAADGGT